MIKQTRVSDISGEEIPEGTGAEMKLTPVDGRKEPVILDVTDAEFKAHADKGRRVARRGRAKQASRRREPASA